MTESTFSEQLNTQTAGLGPGRMVDVSDESEGLRTAVAVGRVELGAEAFDQLTSGAVQDGDVLPVAQIAGIQGAKRTSDLLPLCRDVLLEGVELEFSLDEEERAIEIRAFAKASGRTGVEMEAMTGVSVAALTIYDMCKSISREMSISDVHLVAKTGGQSGDYRRDEQE